MQRPTGTAKHHFILTRYVFGFLVTLMVLTSSGQVKSKDQVSVNYADGSVFIGRLVSEDEIGLRLRLVTGDTILLAPGLIKKIKRSGDYLYHPGGAYHFKQGYFGLISFGLGVSNGFQSTGTSNLTIGKRLNEKWSVGVGIGRAGSDIDLAGIFAYHTFTTLFGYGRYYLGSTKVRPYVDASLGYGIEDVAFFEDDYRGGLHFNPGFGLHFATKNSVKWHIGVSQYLQKVSGQINDFGPFNSPLITEYNVWYNRFLFNIGIEIK